MAKRSVKNQKRRVIESENLSLRDWSRTDLSDVFFQNNITEKMSLKNANLERVKAHAVSFTTVNLDGARVRDATDITGSLFHGCSLKKSDFTGANLAGTLFYQCDLSGARFEGANLRGAVFNECRMDKTIWRGSSLESSLFLECDGESVDFSKSILAHAVLNGCRFDRSYFAGSQGDGLSICNSSIRSAKFSDRRSGVFRSRGFVVRDSDLSRSDFSGAYLYRAHVTGDYISQMKVVGTSFRGAVLTNAYFAADLRNAKFNGAVADYMHLVLCDCRQADFSRSSMRGATLIKGRYTSKKFTPRKGPKLVDRCEGLKAGVVS